MFSPLFLDYPSGTVPVVPLRQTAAVASPSEATPSSISTTLDAAAATPAQEGLDPDKVAQQVFAWIQRKQRIERERKGIQRWH
jgi:hypothetical protein